MRRVMLPSVHALLSGIQPLRVSASIRRPCRVDARTVALASVEKRREAADKEQQ